MRLQDKVCLITGAGGGMGRVAATLFAREGARVAVADVAADAGRETVALIEAAGGEAMFLPCNVAKEAEVVAAMAALTDRWGRLDVLYNNAGIMMAADHSVLDTDEAVWDQTFAVNVKGISFCCKHGIPHMLRQGSGSIINIASFVGLVGCSVPQDAYTASKGAVISLTRSLAVQFAPRGIRTNAICPGPIETPLMTEWLLRDEEARRVRLARNPTGRFGRPEDIAYLALYLASDESAWTNGAIMMADGGITSNYF